MTANSPIPIKRGSYPDQHDGWFSHHDDSPMSGQERPSSPHPLSSLAFQIWCMAMTFLCLCRPKDSRLPTWRFVKVSPSGCRLDGPSPRLADCETAIRPVCLCWCWCWCSCSCSCWCLCLPPSLISWHRDICSWSCSRTSDYWKGRLFFHASPPPSGLPVRCQSSPFRCCM